MTHRIGAKGQVVIPKELRDALQLRPGHEVAFEQQDDGVLIRRAGARSLKGRYAKSDLTNALMHARSEDRALELGDETLHRATRP